MAAPPGARWRTTGRRHRPGRASAAPGCPRRRKQVQPTAERIGVDGQHLASGAGRHDRQPGGQHARSGATAATDDPDQRAGAGRGLGRLGQQIDHFTVGRRQGQDPPGTQLHCRGPVLLARWPPEHDDGVVTTRQTGTGRVDEPVGAEQDHRCQPPARPYPGHVVRDICLCTCGGDQPEEVVEQCLVAGHHQNPFHPGSLGATHAGFE